MIYEEQNIEVKGPDGHPLQRVVVHHLSDGSLRIKLPKRSVVATQLYLRSKDGASILVEPVHGQET